jgi:glutamine---fructose-6-phosphate transaminase (isomerizing)
VVHLDSHEMAVVSAEDARFLDIDGRVLDQGGGGSALGSHFGGPGEYRHFMHKEICEQAEALGHTIGGRVDLEQGRVLLPEMNLPAEQAGR